MMDYKEVLSVHSDDPDGTGGLERRCRPPTPPQVVTAAERLTPLRPAPGIVEVAQLPLA